MLEARRPHLPLVSFPQDRRSLIPPLGAQASSVPLLREHFLQEGYAATRGQWYHPNCKTQDTQKGSQAYALVPENKTEVQKFREHLTDPLDLWSTGSQADDFTSVCEDTILSRYSQ